MRQVVCANAVRRGALVVGLSLSLILQTAHAQTADAPLDPACTPTLQSIVDAAAPGSVVVAPPCVYRETVDLNKPITLVGQAGTEIRGSDIWTDWNLADDGTWVSTLTLPDLPRVTQDQHACDEPNGRCTRPEQVFVDGAQLMPVSAVTPGPGQFGVDELRHVVLGDDPTGHTLEVSTRSRWIRTQADGVTIKGVTMRHAANSAVSGAVSNQGHSDWALISDVLSDAHSADVSLDGGTNLQVLNSDISRGGLVGIAGADFTNGTIRGNVIHENRTQQAAFSRNWGAGGVKLTRVQDVAIDSNEAMSNDAMGLWCDIKCTNVSFSNNRVHHNAWQGINFEISDGGSIHDNVLWENGWGKAEYGWGAGIVISSSANAEVYNNTVAWNYAGISVIWQIRPDSPGPPPVNTNVHDNWIVKKTVNGDFSATYWQNLSLAWLSDDPAAMLYDPASNNRGTDNWVWYDRPEQQTVRFSWATQFFNITRFRDTLGGVGTRYLSDVDKDQLLQDHEVPSSAEH